MRAITSTLLAALSFFPVSSLAQIEEAFPNLTFTAPVDLQNAGDGSNRLFVVEQRGIIRVFDNDSTAAQKSIFLNIQGRVTFGGERGLLGLAFDPDFANNGYLFVDYTASNPDRTVVSRFVVDPLNPNVALADSEQVFLEVSQPFGNHNGGQIAFGPDGYLYISLGDGGSANDPNNHGQNRQTLLGSILRIDVSALPYGIPADNPFVGNGDGYREEIFAYGLRNTWRFSFDSATGRLWGGDVGQDQIEEVNIIRNGRNYGWRIMEGSICRPPTLGCNMTGLTLPVWEYIHDPTVGNSVTGGYVYRGSRNTALIGKYIYADYQRGEIWALDYDGAGGPPSNQLIIDTRLLISSFGVDEDNELYFCTMNSGAIYRFTPLALDDPPGPAPDPRLGLDQNFPNPFHPNTEFEFTIDAPGFVEVDIFDAGGRHLRRLVARTFGMGTHPVTWDAKDRDGVEQPSGVYFYRVRASGGLEQTRRMILLK